MVTAYLGLGSNLGNRLAFLRGGRDSLAARPGIQVLQASAVYETEPLGGPPDSPNFFNAVLAIATALAPRELLEVCQDVEAEFGRTRPGVWAPRTLDVDLLFYGDSLIADGELEVPHPRLHERSFVLVPLLEIAPALVHPGLGRSCRELLAGLGPGGACTLLRASW